MLNIALIGCGRIGSRHLQSLIKLEEEVEIILVDPLFQSIDSSMQLIQEDLKRINNIAVKNVTNINDIQCNLDFVIVASDSKPRFRIIEDLVKNNIPKHLILEKLLFTKLDEFDLAFKLFEENNMNVWVNEWMSSESSFRELCSYFDPNEKIKVDIEGINWGLCCNSVHFIELFDFLCNRQDLILRDHFFYQEIYNSKRKGYLEINGSINLQTNNGSELKLISHEGKEEGEEICIKIQSSSCEAFCKFRMDRLTCNLNIKGKKTKKDYKLTLQSDLTHRIVQNLIRDNSCNLPTYNRSMYHHKIVYPLFKNFFLKREVNLLEGLPIT